MVPEPIKSAPEGRGQSLETLPDVEMSEPHQMVRLVRRMGERLSQQRGKDVQEWYKNVRPRLREPVPFHSMAGSRNLRAHFLTTSYSGAFWKLLTFVKQARNCTFSLVKSVDSLWGGNCYDDNNCTGMIGMANRNEVDFALGMKSSLQFKECCSNNMLISAMQIH